MSDALRPPVRPGMIGQTLDQRGKFPFSAFSFDDPDKSAAPILTLNSPWVMTAELTGRFNPKISSISADYTVTDTDGFEMFFVTGTTVLTIPSASTNTGRVLYVKNAGTGVVTITGTVDGATNPTLDSQYDFAVLISDGTNWYFLDYRSHGSNSNGSWVKWADGTMMQYWVGQLSGTSGTITYPLSFVGALPALGYTVGGPGTDIINFTNWRLANVQWSSNNASLYMTWIVIGKWK